MGRHETEATRASDLKVCGLAAVRAQFAADAGAIQRLYFDYATGRKVGMISRALAQAKKVYRCVEGAELERIAGSVHHGGIIAVVAAPEWRTPGEAELREWARRGEPLLLLDRIGNAHNLGAIARTAAFFGVGRIVVPDDPAAALPGEAAYRVAEGGLAHVEVLRVRDLAALARALAAAGYEVVGATTHGARPPIRQAQGPERVEGRRGAGTKKEIAGAKPVALVLGNEEHGLAPAVAAACTRLVTVPGSGKVESLNVSVAAAVLIWELIARR